MQDIADKLYKRELPEEENSDFSTMYNRQFVDSLLNTVDRQLELERRVGKYENRSQLEILYKHDGEIFSAWEKREVALATTTLKIVGDNDKHVKFFEDQLLKHEDQLKKDFLWSVAYGYTVIQIIYNQDRSGTVDGFQRETFWRFRPQKDMIHVSLANSGNAAMMASRDQLLPYGKWVLAVNNGSSSNPAGEALFSRLYLPWIFRCTTWDGWVPFIEKYGSGFMVGKTPNAGQVDQLRKAMDKAIKNATLAITTQDSVEILNNGTKGEAYKIMDDQLVNKILRMILGETQTSKMEERGGSGSANVHNEVRLEKTISDAKLVEKGINEIITQIALVNDIPLDEAPKAVLMLKQGLETGRADRDVKLHSIGVRQNKKYFINHYGMDEEEFEVEDVDATTEFNDAGSLLLADKAPKSRKLKNGQEKVEEVIKLLLKGDLTPLDNEDVLAAMQSSKSVGEMEGKLTALFEEGDPAFAEQVAEALYHVAILGAEDAQEKG